MFSKGILPIKTIADLVNFWFLENKPSGIQRYATLENYGGDLGTLNAYIILLKARKALS